MKLPKFVFASCDISHFQNTLLSEIQTNQFQLKSLVSASNIYSIMLVVFE